VNPALQGYLAAVEEDLATDGQLADAADQVRSLAAIVDGSAQLMLALDDGAVPVAARRSVLDHLLEGKALPGVRRLVHQAVTVVPASEITGAFHWLAARLARAAGDPAEPDEPLGRLAARRRVGGYAAALFESASVGQLEEIEDQLFRFARTVEANRPLRTALGDRDLPVAVRQQLISDLLDGRALPAAVRLARYAARGGRARDFVSLLDALVEAAATARGWRVARVRAAAEVDDRQRDDLAGSLRQLTGGPVELHVTVNPDLLGGAVVEIGDLLVDGSARHRLDQLKEHVLVAGAAASASSLHETAPVHEGRTEGREHT
jgi:F-type H+-transporting ATPase subunit delta